MSKTFVQFLEDLPGTSRRLSAGELLFERGEPVRRAWLVREGMVHLNRRREDGAAFLLQRAGPGSLVAEASLLSRCYHCAAHAAEASVLTGWPLARVRALIETEPAAALAMARHLAREVRAARQRAEIASLRRVRDRLDAWLAWHDGVLPPRGHWHHLAGELSVSAEALYREIARRRLARGATARQCDGE